MNDAMNVIQAVCLAILAVLLLAALVGLPTMLLWNSLVPNIFGLPQITFAQAVGLSLLSQCFFAQCSFARYGGKSE